MVVLAGIIKSVGKQLSRADGDFSYYLMPQTYNTIVDQMDISGNIEVFDFGINELCI